MSIIENVSRRRFVQGALAGGVLILGVRYVPKMLHGANAPAAPVAGLEPSLWMSIASDGTVTLVAHRSEMGCGSRTALPLVVADELDADWSKVKIDQAIGDPKYGDQDTDGSHSVRSSFDLMRQESGVTVSYHPPSRSMSGSRLRLTLLISDWIGPRSLVSKLMLSLMSMESRQGP